MSLEELDSVDRVRRLEPIGVVRKIGSYSVMRVVVMGGEVAR